VKKLSRVGWPDKPEKEHRWEMNQEQEAEVVNIPALLRGNVWNSFVDALMSIPRGSDQVLHPFTLRRDTGTARLMIVWFHKSHLSSANDDW